MSSQSANFNASKGLNLISRYAAFEMSEVHCSLEMRKRLGTIRCVRMPSTV